MFYCSAGKRGGGPTLCESHDVPYLPALAQQNCQLFNTPVLLQARHLVHLWPCIYQCCNSVWTKCSDLFLIWSQQGLHPLFQPLVFLVWQNKRVVKMLFLDSHLPHVLWNFLACDGMFSDRHDSHANMDKRAKPSDNDSTTTCKANLQLSEWYGCCWQQHCFLLHLILTITFYIKKGFPRQIKQTHRVKEMVQLLFHILSNLMVKVMQKGQLLALSGNWEANYVMPMSQVISAGLATWPLKIKPSFLSSCGICSVTSPVLQWSQPGVQMR